MGNRKSVFTCIGASNHTEKERQNEDYYATEPKAAQLLLEVEKFKPTVWECACGGGHLAEVFKANGYNVLATDLIDRGYGKSGIDFLTTDKLPCDCDIITNPPYKYAKEFVEKALDLLPVGGKVAMFLKLTFLEGKTRRKLFEKSPPRKIYVASERLNCAMNGDFAHYFKNGAVAYGWYVWEKGYNGDTVVKWIN